METKCSECWENFSTVLKIIDFLKLRFGDRVKFGQKKNNYWEKARGHRQFYCSPRAIAARDRLCNMIPHSSIWESYRCVTHAGLISLPSLCINPGMSHRVNIQDHWTGVENTHSTDTINMSDHFYELHLQKGKSWSTTFTKRSFRILCRLQ